MSFSLIVACVKFRVILIHDRYTYMFICEKIISIMILIHLFILLHGNKKYHIAAYNIITLVSTQIMLTI